MVSQTGSISVSPDAIFDDADVQADAAQSSHTPIRGIAIAALLGLVLWVGIIWAAVQVAGFVW